MVDRTRELEYALGAAIKRIETNETDTVVLQRRAIRASQDLFARTIITGDQLTVLRPCPEGGLPPYQMAELIGRKLRRDISKGEHLRWTDLE
jgi:N-acetylneuraminate synthase